MKKLISVFLCIVMLCVPLGASALPLSAGDEALTGQFVQGLNSILNYSYFAPEIIEGEAYPLVIWLHGLASGNYSGDELESYDFCKWASDEFQARFAYSGKAFLLCPRCPGGWDLTTTGILMGCIESFISKYPDSVDTSRIYIAGFSVGAVMVLRMVNDYPNFFAGAVPISATAQNSSYVKNMKNTAVWFFANEKDMYIGANASSTRGSYDLLKDVISDKSKLRFTWVSSAVTPGGKTLPVQHYMWRIFTNDMFMEDGSQYAFSTTLDGSGNTIEFTFPNGIISWLSSQIKPALAPSSQAVGVWAKLAAFFKSIAAWFRSLFSLK